MGTGLNTLLRLKIPISYPARIGLPLLIFRDYFVRQLLISNWKFKIDAVSRTYFRIFIDVDAGISLDRLLVLRSYLFVAELRPLGIDDIRYWNIGWICVPVLKCYVGLVDTVSSLRDDRKRHDGLLGMFKELDK